MNSLEPTPLVPGTRVRTSIPSDAPESRFLSGRTGVIRANDAVVDGATLGDPMIGLDAGDLWVQIDNSEELGSIDIYAFRVSELIAIEPDEETSDDDRG